MDKKQIRRRMQKMQRRQRNWKELSGSQRARISIMSIAELIMSAWALLDLRRRPENEVRGSKKLWALLAFVQPVGPIAYLVWGRKKEKAALA